MHQATPLWFALNIEILSVEVKTNEILRKPSVHSKYNSRICITGTTEHTPMHTKKLSESKMKIQTASLSHAKSTVIQ